MEGKSFTLSGRDFDYTKLRELLFSGDWSKPLLAQPGQDEGSDMLLVAEALSRGNSKTEGFKSRIVPVPGRVVPLLSSPTVATFSKAQMDEIGVFDAALRDAVALVAAGGNDEIKKSHFQRSDPARKRFDRKADRLFFPNLWDRVAASEAHDADAEATAKIKFLKELRTAAEEEWHFALPAIPCPAIQRPKAEAKGRRAFYARLRREHPVLFNREEDTDVAA
jgi:CRISPR system Cascade subunit CasA